MSPRRYTPESLRPDPDAFAYDAADDIVGAGPTIPPKYAGGLPFGTSAAAYSSESSGAAAAYGTKLNQRVEFNQAVNEIVKDRWNTIRLQLLPAATLGSTKVIAEIGGKDVPAATSIQNVRMKDGYLIIPTMPTEFRILAESRPEDKQGKTSEVKSFVGHNPLRVQIKFTLDDTLRGLEWDPTYYSLEFHRRFANSWGSDKVPLGYDESTELGNLGFRTDYDPAHGGTPLTPIEVILYFLYASIGKARFKLSDSARPKQFTGKWKSQPLIQSNSPLLRDARVSFPVVENVTPKRLVGWYKGLIPRYEDDPTVRTEPVEQQIVSELSIGRGFSLIGYVTAVEVECKMWGPEKDLRKVEVTLDFEEVSDTIASRQSQFTYIMGKDGAVYPISDRDITDAGNLIRARENIRRSAREWIEYYQLSAIRGFAAGAEPDEWELTRDAIRAIEAFPANVKYIYSNSNFSQTYNRSVATRNASYDPYKTETDYLAPQDPGIDEVVRASTDTRTYQRGSASYVKNTKRSLSNLWRNGWDGQRPIPIDSRLAPRRNSLSSSFTDAWEAWSTLPPSERQKLLQDYLKERGTKTPVIREVRGKVLQPQYSKGVFAPTDNEVQRFDRAANEYYRGIFREKASP